MSSHTEGEGGKEQFYLMTQGCGKGSNIGQKMSLKCTYYLNGNIQRHSNELVQVKKDDFQLTTFDKDVKKIRLTDDFK